MVQAAVVGRKEGASLRADMLNAIRALPLLAYMKLKTGSVALSFCVCRLVMRSVTFGLIKRRVS